jgi:hypothetical protein
LGVAIAQRSFPESVRFVEQHFGSKTHVQNVLLAREVISMGGELGVHMQAMRQLTDACSSRIHGGPDDA